MNHVRFFRPATGIGAIRRARVGAARMSRAVVQSPRSLFLRELLAQPTAVGALCASSQRLAARMAAHVDPVAPGLVVELGGGTGVITAALLARGVCGQRLVVFEQSGALAALLQRRFPQALVIHGDAATLAQRWADGQLPCDAAGQPLPIGTIVSGLPLLSIPLPIRLRILQAAAQALAPGGQLLQFTYALRGPSPWQAVGLERRCCERVLANLPPARIDVLRPASLAG